MLMLQLWHIVMDLGTEPFPGAIFHHLECILHRFLGRLMGPTYLDCVLEKRKKCRFKPFQKLPSDHHELSVNLWQHCNFYWQMAPAAISK